MAAHFCNRIYRISSMFDVPDFPKKGAARPCLLLT